MYHFFPKKARTQSPKNVTPENHVSNFDDSPVEVSAQLPPSMGDPGHS